MNFFTFFPTELILHIIKIQKLCYSDLRINFYQTDFNKMNVISVFYTDNNLIVENPEIIFKINI